MGELLSEDVVEFLAQFVPFLPGVIVITLLFDLLCMELQKIVAEKPFPFI
jgi:hypothetical protein